MTTFDDGMEPDRPVRIARSATWSKRCDLVAAQLQKGDVLATVAGAYGRQARSCALLSVA
jgi:hypothetical protein